ncbi:RNA ligase family protein [Viridibacillus sp. FSL H8-0123]|uniref:ATP-dependent DNA ligase n=1 Tax=Viridibacillus sp. FSL H8-0123 TaxID=1928922 RepID=UPI00117E45EF|nr:RNA ligase family protein [Viridibacillus sp. FSL H8-0123]
MLLTAAEEIPTSTEWLYETKYDGFRCGLEWEDEPILKSRHGNILNSKFPEIISFCNDIRERIKPFLPLSLDGELVYLTNNFQSIFSVVQTRGRMRSQNTIVQHANSFPCHNVVFDYMTEKGENISNLQYTERKQKLSELFKRLNFPLTLNYLDKSRLQIIEVFDDSRKIWNLVKDYNGEGIVAKKKQSPWKSDTRSSNWVKIKNYKYVTIILTKFNKHNGFFHGAVYKNNALIEIASFRHGLSEEEFSTLVELFHKNGKRTAKDILSIDPSICLEVACIDFAFEKLREPR